MCACQTELVRKAYKQANGVLSSTSTAATEKTTGAPRADSEQPSEQPKVPPSGPKADRVPVKETPVKSEPVDPLQMDIDEEDIEYEPEKLNEEVSILWHLWFSDRE